MTRLNKTWMTIVLMPLLLSPALANGSSRTAPKATTNDTARIEQDPADKPVEYSVLDIPVSVEFCGKTIDLTRFDRRERMDRELLAFMYMHSTSLQMIKRANRYFPAIEPILKSNGIPDDFKYLMTIESNVNPTARSKAGAAGLWQFMPATGRAYGLEVNDNIDERYHVEKATRAACRYLKEAYDKYGDWVAVAASYNAGQARISQQLEKQAVTNSLDLHLIEETARYVYRILAAKIMFHRPGTFGFRLKAADLYPVIPCKEYAIPHEIPNLVSWAKTKNINYSILKQMNPWLREDKLLNKTHRTYILHVPTKEGLYYDPHKTIAYDERWITK